MCLTEYNKQKVMQQIQAEAYEDGLEVGIEKGYNQAMKDSAQKYEAIIAELEAQLKDTCKGQ